MKFIKIAKVEEKLKSAGNPTDPLLINICNLEDRKGGAYLDWQAINDEKSLRAEIDKFIVSGKAKELLEKSKANFEKILTFDAKDLQKQELSYQDRRVYLKAMMQIPKWENLLFGEQPKEFTYRLSNPFLYILSVSVANSPLAEPTDKVLQASYEEMSVPKIDNYMQALAGDRLKTQTLAKFGITQEDIESGIYVLEEKTASVYQNLNKQVSKLTNQVNQLKKKNEAPVVIKKAEENLQEALAKKEELAPIYEEMKSSKRPLGNKQIFSSYFNTQKNLEGEDALNKVSQEDIKGLKNDWVVIPGGRNVGAKIKYPEDIRNQIRGLDVTTSDARGKIISMLTNSAGWCIGGLGTAKDYTYQGDFWFYVEGGAPRVAIRFIGSRIQEVRGLNNKDITIVPYADKVYNLCQRHPHINSEMNKTGHYNLKKLREDEERVKDLSGKNIEEITNMVSDPEITSNGHAFYYLDNSTIDKFSKGAVSNMDECFADLHKGDKGKLLSQYGFKIDDELFEKKVRQGLGRSELTIALEKANIKLNLPLEKLVAEVRKKIESLRNEKNRMWVNRKEITKLSKVENLFYSAKADAYINGLENMDAKINAKIQDSAKQEQALRKTRGETEEDEARRREDVKKVRWTLNEAKDHKKEIDGMRKEIQASRFHKVCRDRLVSISPNEVEFNLGRYSFLKKDPVVQQLSIELIKKELETIIEEGAKDYLNTQRVDFAKLNNQMGSIPVKHKEVQDLAFQAYMRLVNQRESATQKTLLYDVQAIINQSGAAPLFKGVATEACIDAIKDNNFNKFNNIRVHFDLKENLDEFKEEAFEMMLERASLMLVEDQMAFNNLNDFFDEKLSEPKYFDVIYEGALGLAENKVINYLAENDLTAFRDILERFPELSARDEVKEAVIRMSSTWMVHNPDLFQQVDRVLNNELSRGVHYERIYQQAIQQATEVAINHLDASNYNQLILLNQNFKGDLFDTERFLQRSVTHASRILSDMNTSWDQTEGYYNDFKRLIGTPLKPYYQDIAEKTYQSIKRDAQTAFARGDREKIGELNKRTRGKLIKEKVQEIADDSLGEAVAYATSTYLNWNNIRDGSDSGESPLDKMKGINDLYGGRLAKNPAFYKKCVTLSTMCMFYKGDPYYDTIIKQIQDLYGKPIVTEKHVEEFRSRESKRAVGVAETALERGDYKELTRIMNSYPMLKKNERLIRRAALKAYNISKNPPSPEIKLQIIKQLDALFEGRVLQTKSGRIAYERVIQYIEEAKKVPQKDTYVPRVIDDPGGPRPPGYQPGDDEDDLVYQHDWYNIFKTS